MHKAYEVINSYPAIHPLSKSYNNSDLSADTKWKVYYQGQNSPRYNNLVPFSKYAKVMRGIATGANDFFTFNMNKAREYGIGEECLLPCICRSADVKGNIFTLDDFNKLKSNDKKVFLLNAENSKSENTTAYIKQGETDGINKKHLTSKRNPWYALEKRPPAPIWVSVFNRNGLRFVRNLANVSNLTTFHCLYLNTEQFSEISIDLFLAYLLSETAHSIFNDNAREYGNGLQKFEPNNLNHSFVLDLELIPTTAKSEIEQLYRKSITTKDSSFIKRIDEILSEVFGI